jgi:hypothetical protein
MIKAVGFTNDGQVFMKMSAVNKDKAEIDFTITMSPDEARRASKDLPEAAQKADEALKGIFG